jgi:hypothetical protein
MQVRRWRGAVLTLAVALAAGCGRLLDDRAPLANAPADVPRVTFEIVARDNRCEPSVLAADRQGRALLITFQVTSVGKQHVFLIPDLEVRVTIPAGTQVSIPVLAEHSGIYKFGCTGLAWLGPLDHKGKLAIK